MSRLITLAITMGDPAGIGPEIVLRALTSKKRKLLPASFLVVGDFALLRFVQEKILKRSAGAPRLRLVSSEGELRAVAAAGEVGVFDVGRSFDDRPVFGRATALGGRLSGDAIEEAVRLALRGAVSGVVTAPINKVAFQKGGWGEKYIGHTEMLAALSGAPRAALMLVCGNLRAVHVTSHLPLRRVPEAIDQEKVMETIQMAHAAGPLFGFRRPRIAVCGLNPHAGDGGLMGHEEQEIIAPAVRRCRKAGLRVEGPLPADTAWPRMLAGDFEFGVAMYHDQGQIPVKLLSHQAFHEKGKSAGVNVTVGIPFVRTSVDHGTAYSIAGKGLASEESLLAAMRLAVDLVRRRWRR